MSDDCVGPALEECPVCGAVGLPKRIQQHDCAAFCERRDIPTPTSTAVADEATDDR